MIKYHFRKVIRRGRFQLSVNWRKGSNLTRRFGGGWNWVVGFELGKGTLILNCLVFYVRFEWRKK